MPNERNLEELIIEALDSRAYEDDIDGYSFAEASNIKQVSTFAENGLLTRDHGLVLKMDDGSEFQLTIKRSK